MAPNPLDEHVDPADPGSLIRWTARAAAAFEGIREDVREIKDNQAAASEWRIGVESRMMAEAQTVQGHGLAISELRGQIVALPDLVMKAVERALNGRASNPGAGRRDGSETHVTFRWFLEKLALPLLMSGVGAAITIMVARAAGAFGP